MSRIKREVKQLTKKYKTNNPYEIAAAKNIYVIERDLHESIYGFYKYIRKNKFIFINSNIQQTLKPFTCAHELGHSEMHPRVNTPFLKANTLFTIDKIEVEANKFAVELLLPDEELYQYQHTNLSIHEISELYGIPRDLAHLKSLGQKIF
ncbi:ImmA/IrrE family metallo-endopeptidase [Bacillus sp. Hm123]|uniref:ImmA/IrrE family metallo-endopeptidase n=1 Tax=Bacillus sp. Hm123 TaxID=3450745 RepID=UPI003F41F76E